MSCDNNNINKPDTNHNSERIDKPARNDIKCQPPTLLMCAPHFFDVRYVINPWMEGNTMRSDNARANGQWHNLHHALAERATIKLINPQENLPDMVFTANAGFIWGNNVIVSRFCHSERRGEEAYFRAWFAENGYEIAAWDDEIAFEGAGDALFQRISEPFIWLGYGFRTSAAALPHIAALSGREVLPLRLVDPHFYHLDTCLCPLSDGYVMWWPSAFDEASQMIIKNRVLAEKLIAVSEEDANKFACNAVEIGGDIFLNSASHELEAKLSNIGFRVFQLPLGEFMRAGGSAKCLTLRLDENV